MLGNSPGLRLHAPLHAYIGSCAVLSINCTGDEFQGGTRAAEGPDNDGCRNLGGCGS